MGTEKKRIALGMSGGVDSSVAAYMLQREGFEVVGVTCLFQGNEVDWRSAHEARGVCDRFEMQHITRDCSNRFTANVIDPFVQAYANGLTPSPCVGCNVTMKLPELLVAADELGCEYVATGHYARVTRSEAAGRFAIEMARDQAKDQSYMLCLLTQEQLARLCLPLGELTKPEVRDIARELGLAMADNPESQDICFAPHGYRSLLAQHGIANEPGDIVLDGRVVGTHTGLIDYTIGQRKGIGVAGPEPYFVLEKCPKTNELLIGTAGRASMTWARVENVNWQSFAALEAPLEVPLEAMVKLRYRSTPYPCKIRLTQHNDVMVYLASPQKVTAPGQFAVFYEGSTVLGGGTIKEVG